MAGMHSVSISFQPKSLFKPPLSSHASTPLPFTPKKRKNYLRPKILKTLTKPLPSTRKNPMLPSEPEPLPDQIPNELLEETNQVQEFQASDTLGVAEEHTGAFGKFFQQSFLSFGFYFLGMVVLHTVYLVLVSGNANTEEKDENLDGLDGNVSSHKGHKNRGKPFIDRNRGLFNNGKLRSNSTNVVYRDEAEFERKISEIRGMARQARKFEEKELENDSEEDDFYLEGLKPKRRNGILKEIDARLDKLEKRLNSGREKLPGSFMSFLDKIKNADDAHEVDNSMMFKKKFKFKGPELNSGSKPKGFSGSKDGISPKNKKNGLTVSSSGRMEVNNGNKAACESSHSLQTNEAKFKTGKKTEAEDASRNRTIGAAQETSEVDSSAEVGKSRSLRNLESQNLQNFTNENLEISINSDKCAFPGPNGHSKCRDTVNKPIAKEIEAKPPVIQTDLWWLNLPYVLAVFMQRDLDRGGPGGLFTLRIPSQTEDQSNTSYTVAFEDRGDANNFCYLLESFFEDLQDFSAEVVPFSVKELHEAVKSHASNVIVVKKGQLKLYAGQSFDEVEMALKSLIEENQQAYT